MWMKLVSRKSTAMKSIQVVLKNEIDTGSSFIDIDDGGNAFRDLEGVGDYLSHEEINFLICYAYLCVRHLTKRTNNRVQVTLSVSHPGDHKNHRQELD
ncbi:hypothetical protein L1887_07425 [Cichorium endivia]|nr:hypothetical protein L1887_07425 [Cichorium endivia]